MVVSPPAKAVWLGMFLAACLLPALLGNSQSANPVLLPSAPAPNLNLVGQEMQPTVTSSGAEPPPLAMAQAIVGSLLALVLPAGWHHGLRVGPGYYR